MSDVLIIRDTSGPSAQIIGSGPAGAKGDPGSGGEGYATRAAIAALVPTAWDDAYLTESGYEGKFVFDPANLSTEVAADASQINYIAPSSAATGAAGAWVRKIDREVARPEIWVLTGQSNAVGIGTGALPAAHPKVKVWDRSAAKFVIADLAAAALLISPVPGGGGSAYSIGGGKNNIGVAFCNRRYRETGRPQYLVVVARGATDIDTGWLAVGNTVYDDLKAQVEAALASIGATEIDGVLFHQGEQDYSLSTPGQTYWTRLNDLMAKFKAEAWWSDRARFVAGEPYLRVSDITQQLRRVNGESLGVSAATVSSEGLTLEPADPVHFDGASLFEFGYRRYYEAMFGGHGGLAKDIPQQKEGSITTATIIGLTTNPTITGLSVTGQWSKQGTQVHLRIQLVFTAASGGSGACRIDIPGLPPARATQFLNIHYRTGFLAAVQLIRLQAATTQLSIQPDLASGSFLTPPNALNSAGGTIFIQGTYTTDEEI